MPNHSANILVVDDEVNQRSALASVVARWGYQVETASDGVEALAKLKDFDAGLAEDFFRSVANHAGMNLHIRILYGRDVHHMLEGIFKAFGRALDQATSLDPRIKGVLSTKGKI